MKLEHKGHSIELEEFNQEENGGHGITWTSYVYKNKEDDYIDKYTVSCESLEELKMQVISLIDKDLKQRRIKTP